MAEEKDNIQPENPFQQLLAKMSELEGQIKELEKENTSIKAQFKDFSDFNASLLNQGSGQPSVKPDNKAVAERRQYLDDICRKGAMK